MLALLNRLEPASSIPLDELASLLGVSVSEIADDMTALSCCGLAPYDPGSLVAVFVEDGMVNVWGPLPALDRAVRLSAAEARALVTALQAAGFGPENPLTSKLLDAATTDFSAEDLVQTIRAGVAGSASDVYKTLAGAIERSEVVRIAYRRGGSGSETRREIEPSALLNDRGVWYVSAFCRLAGAMRTFRLDRMRDAETTGAHFTPRTQSLRGRAFDPDGLPVALLRFTDAEEYSEREWPGSRIHAVDGSGLEVEVPYSGTAWISRMVVARLGSVEVIEPEEVRASVRELAESMLH